MLKKDRVVNSMFLSLFGAVITTLACSTAGMAAETSYIRELAKNHTAVDIITSGPGSEDVGRSLQTAILQHPENKHKPSDVLLMSLDDVERSNVRSNNFSKASTIFILELQNNSIAIPAALAHSFPSDPQDLKPGLSVLKGVMTHGPDQGLAFSVAMVAPDSERLTRLFQEFVRHSADSYRGLAVQRNYVSNKVALFSSPEDRNVIEHWGERSDPLVWNYVRWYPMTEREQLKPEQLDGYNIAYFVNRSRAGVDLPPEAVRALATEHPTDLESVVARAAGDGRMIAVFSSPSKAILARKASRYADLSEIPGEPVTDQATDLRWLGRAGIVVRGVHLSPDVAEGLRFKLAEQMRRRLQTPVEEPDPTQGYTHTAGDNSSDLGQAANVKYMWLVQYTRYSGSTTYSGSETRVTPDPGPFTEIEPSKPDRDRDEKDDDYHDRLADWRLERERWERRRIRYEDDRRLHMPVQWDRDMVAHYRAVTEGELRLVDLNKPAQPVWAATFGLTADADKPYKSDTVTVNGQDNHPDSIEAPPNDDTCPPDLLEDTAYKAAGTALDTLQEKTLLPVAGGK